MARIRIIRLLAALLLGAVAAPTGGAAVRSAAHADSLPPTVVPAPSVPPDSSAIGAAIGATMDDEEDDASQTTPPDALIAPDGTLRLDGAFTGAVDLSGWHVTLDPERGPIFHPQSLTWDHLGTRPGAINNRVYAIAMSGGNVYVGGDFTDAGGDNAGNYLTRWNGSAFVSFGGGPVAALNDIVSAIAVSGTNLYVGGFFTDAGGNPNADFVARWDGSAWQALGVGLNSSVFAIAVSGTDLYVGGYFTDAGGNPNADIVGRASLLKKAYLPLIAR